MADSCRHTRWGASLDFDLRGGLTAGRVPAGDAPEQPGRVGGAVFAAGAQRATPADRGADREGDPQLRSGGAGRSGRAGPAGVVDLAVPGLGGRGRGRSGMEVEVLDSRRLGGAWTLDRV